MSPPSTLVLRLLRYSLRSGVQRKKPFSTSRPRPADNNNESNVNLVPPSSRVILTSSTKTLISLRDAVKRTRLGNGRIPLLVLLLTPAHIDLVEHRTGYVSRLLGRSFDSPELNQECDILIAVVDRIPLSLSRLSQKSRDRSLLLSAVKNPLGYEGASIACLDSIAAAPDLWSVKDQPSEREPVTTEQRCCISFSFAHRDTKISKNPPNVLRVVQMPVANTLFKNGQTSTLVAQRWLQVSPSEWAMTRQTGLPYQTIQVSNGTLGDATQVSDDLRTQLKQITPPRVVSAAVGNIIRRIHIDDGAAESVPASQELESVIDSQIQSGEIQHQAPGIWALIRQGNTSDTAGSDYAKRPQVDSLQVEGLPGSRLHKVLSGGGGWGKKQGLLALDPDSEYLQSNREVLPSPRDDYDIAEGSPPVFESLVNVGDSVTFFINQPGTKSDDSETDRAFHHSGPTRIFDIRQSTFEFGSIPSTIDVMPSNSEGEAKTMVKDSVSPGAIMINNYFGMLSEQGMSLKSTSCNSEPPNVASSGQLGQSDTENSLPNFDVATKLDAPFTVLSFTHSTTRTASTKSIESHTSGGFDSRMLRKHLFISKDRQPATKVLAVDSPTSLANLLEGKPRNEIASDSPEDVLISKYNPTDNTPRDKARRAFIASKREGGSKASEKPATNADDMLSRGRKRWDDRPLKITRYESLRNYEDSRQQWGPVIRKFEVTDHIISRAGARQMPDFKISDKS